MICDDPTLPPRYLVENYRQAYSRLNRREPQCRYIGNHCYNVNGETVHRLTLLGEIARLRDMAQRSSFLNTDKSILQRIIARLRAI